MFIVSVGLNHKTAPVEIRERIAFPSHLLPAALAEAATDLKETVILSTCNRMELYCLARNPHDGYRGVKRFLSRFHGLEEHYFADHLYFHTNDSAVRHLFCVSSGIDSMIIGEPQILGQVKSALDQAMGSHTTDKVLSALFRQAVTVGKRARTETAIGQNAVSVSYVAVELARKIFGRLDTLRVLLIGAGEMSELAARTLLDCGARSVAVANRTLANAEELASRIGGKATGLDSLEDSLQEADVVISSTGASELIIGPKLLRQVMRARHNRPLFLVDIAVPRDIDPEVQRLENVFLYDIDDLQDVIAANQREREREVEKVRAIIDEETEKFVNWFKSLEVVPLIVAMRQRAEDIRQMEIGKASTALADLSEQHWSALNALTSAIVNKILHEPTVRLKQHANGKNGYVYTEAIRELFGLDENAAREGEQ